MEEIGMYLSFDALNVSWFEYALYAIFSILVAILIFLIITDIVQGVLESRKPQATKTNTWYTEANNTRYTSTTSLDGFYPSQNSERPHQDRSTETEHAINSASQATITAGIII